MADDGKVGILKPGGWVGMTVKAMTAAEARRFWIRIFASEALGGLLGAGEDQGLAEARSAAWYAEALWHELENNIFPELEKGDDDAG